MLSSPIYLCFRSNHLYVYNVRMLLLNKISVKNNKIQYFFKALADLKHFFMSEHFKTFNSSLCNFVYSMAF